MPYERMSGIREKIKRAKKHIEDFKSELQIFHDSKPYAIRVDVDSSPMQPIVQILKADPVPPYLACIVGDAIHNLRSALDHLACELVMANGNIPTQKTEFPILDQPITTSKLESRFAAKVEGMRKEVVDAIRNIHPYQGGSNTLWRLHRLDVTDKHKTVIAGIGNITAVNGPPPIEEQWKGNRWLSFGAPAVLKRGHQFQFVNLRVEKSTRFFAEVVFNELNVAEGYPVILGLIQFEREVTKIVGALSWGLK
jgi:hypothetical protein